MTNRLSLFLASTALAVALGLPALAAMDHRDTGQGACLGPCAGLSDDGHRTPLMMLASDDDDDHRGSSRHGRDHDGDDDDCDDDDEDDDDCSGAGAGMNPAPAGTVAPPANGLFGNGAPPAASTN